MKVPGTSSLMTMTEMFLERLVYSPLNHVTRLVDRVYFIEFSPRVYFNLYSEMDNVDLGYKLITYFRPRKTTESLDRIFICQTLNYSVASVQQTHILRQAGQQFCLFS
jgi:hypothetical protein